MKLTTKLVHIFDPSATPGGTKVKVDCKMNTICDCCPISVGRMWFTGVADGVINWTTENEVEVLIDGHDYNFAADNVAEGLVTITEVTP